MIALSQKCFARVDRRGVGSQVGVSPYRNLVTVADLLARLCEVFDYQEVVIFSIHTAFSYMHSAYQDSDKAG
jgi:hypothetical protein